MILLADETRDKLQYHTGIGYEKEIERNLISANFSITGDDHGNVIINAFRSQEPCLLNQMGSSEKSESLDIDLFKQIGSSFDHLRSHYL